MLHDRQGSIGLFGPFAYTIAAAYAAANADNAASSRVAREAKPAAPVSRKPSGVKSLLEGLLSPGTWLTQPLSQRTV